MSDLDHVYASKFNYWDEIRPAITDGMVELAMAMRLVDEEDLTLRQARNVVHDIVHVSKHYMVIEGPAPVNPTEHEQTK